MIFINEFNMVHKGNIIIAYLNDSCAYCDRILKDLIIVSAKVCDTAWFSFAIAIAMPIETFIHIFSKTDP